MLGDLKKIIKDFSNPGTQEHVLEVIEKSDLSENHKLTGNSL